MSSIKVLLAEDHTIVRKGLVALLTSELGIEVVGEAEDGREAVKRVQELVPDVVVMDISMPNLNGLEATRQIKKVLPEIKVLILTVHTTEEYVFQILRAGANGYVVKQAAPEELISAIHCVCRGDTYLSPVISRVVVEEYIQNIEATMGRNSFDKLTGREREVLQLIAEGNSTRQIARKLYISVKTVETHRSHLMGKLGLHTAAELTRYALRRGLVDRRQ